AAGVGEAVALEDLRELEAAAAAAAVDDDLLVAPLLKPLGVRLHLLDRDELATVDLGDVRLLRETAIDQHEIVLAGRLLVEQALGLARRDLEGRVEVVIGGKAAVVEGWVWNAQGVSH